MFGRKSAFWRPRSARIVSNHSSKNAGNCFLMKIHGVKSRKIQICRICRIFRPAEFDFWGLYLVQRQILSTFCFGHFFDPTTFPMSCAPLFVFGQKMRPFACPCKTAWNIALGQNWTLLSRAVSRADSKNTWFVEIGRLELFLFQFLAFLQFYAALSVLEPLVSVKKNL